MKLLEDIERRLQNWARWKLGASDLGYSGVNYAALGDMAGAGVSGYREATIPTNDAEASDTDDAIKALDSELRAAVEAHYLGNGSQRKTAERLHCSQSTVMTRLHRAHLRINEWLHAKRESARAERSRVEALQRAAAR